MVKKKAAVRKRKQIAMPGRLKLGQMRRAAKTELKKVRAALEAGRVSNKTKARKLISQLNKVVKMSDDQCPFEIQFDPTAF